MKRTKFKLNPTGHVDSPLPVYIACHVTEIGWQIPGDGFSREHPSDAALRQYFWYIFYEALFKPSLSKLRGMRLMISSRLFVVAITRISMTYLEICGDSRLYSR